ncbi:MAG: S46 family peptidase [Bacteroidetes bacterium]|nr:S46 family peptidase [Bacteroidota bacterium]
MTMYLRNRALLLIVGLLVVSSLVFSDEGMYPISDLKKINLKKIGLQISAKDLYNPNGVSLIDAIVHLGGCTGSFVSNDGLILTNHHCAFGSVAAASSTEHDYVTDGFLAKTRADEIPARGQSVRLIESYRDVSTEVLSAVSDTMDLAARTRAISKKMSEIVAETEKAQAGRRAEVAEMFTGKSYVLFVYFFIKDVRLVYAPPRSIGEFGGEDDNWVWPRHTGDFSYLRAYVAPDGTPADYSPDNIPYHPKRFLKVNPAGVDENDAVFILGYPGRTFRHRTASFLAYEERSRMPFIADLFEWQINTMEELSKNDRAVALKHDARIKGLANTSKNYRGKLKGLERLQLVASKEADERLLQQYIEQDPARKAKYGNVLAEIAAVYAEMSAAAPSELVLDATRMSSTLLGIAATLSDAVSELQKPEADRLPAYLDRNIPRLKDNFEQQLKNYYEPTERAFLTKLFSLAATIPADQRIAALDAAVGGDYSDASVERFLEHAIGATKLSDPGFLKEVLAKTPAQLDSLNEPLVRLAKGLAPESQRLREVRQRREGALSKNYALLVDVKAEYLKTSFIPDANSTMRFTYGRIKGYSPADAVYYSPITTLRGVVEKSKKEFPYATPERILELAKNKDYGRYKHPKLNDVPVAILYDMDTTGGNSGSPVMNAKGELIGLNFDRAFEATINDYAWSASYSRSIAVDIRYVLWVTEKLGEAKWLLEEMGVR